MMIQKKTLLAIAVGVFLAGCGGGGGFQLPKTTSGFAVDGYLIDASVLCDVNENGVYDAGEAVVLSDKTINSKGGFAFPGGCASGIVVFGGTDLDTGVQFRGVLKAPAGSTYITPLTSLMADAGLTAAQVAAAMGLPFGTDVTKIDPNGNLDLKRRTLAVQQIIQQVASVLAILDDNASPQEVRAINSAVTKSIAATLLLNSNAALIDASGNVADAVVSAIVIDSLARVAASSDPLLGSAKVTLGAYSGNNIAELISASITAQANVIAKAGSAATLVANVKSLQANSTIAAAARNLTAFLTKANSNLNLTETGRSLVTLATTDTVSTAHQNAGTALLSEIGTQAGINNISTPSFNSNGLATATDYLYATSDQIALNGTSYSLQQFANGAPQLTSFQTLSFAYGVNGIPIPTNSAGTMTAGVRLGIELTSSRGQVLQLILDNADITLSAANQLSVTIPANAQMHVYGRTSGGTTVTATLPYATADNFFVAANGRLTINANNMLNTLTGSNQAALAVLNDLKGTFNLRMVISNLSLRDDPAATTALVNQLAIIATGSTQPPVNGLGIQGLVTLQ